jgi:hypothetical protein
MAWGLNSNTPKSFIPYQKSSILDTTEGYVIVYAEAKKGGRVPARKKHDQGFQIEQASAIWIRKSPNEARAR